jgi:Stress responsive A/B Barrel Domain
VIRHCVFFRFKTDVSDQTIVDLLAGLAALKDMLPAIRNAVAGANISPEGLERGFRHGFTMDFDNESAREAYFNHPARIALADRVLANLEGGLEGVIVVDLDM